MPGDRGWEKLATTCGRHWSRLGRPPAPKSLRPAAPTAAHAAHATCGGQQSCFHPSYYAEICIASDPVRTTLNLSDDLLTEAKALAAREKLTLTRLIEEGLALRLHQHQRPMSPATRLPLPVHQGKGGLAAAVDDPRSNRSLLDAADGLKAP